MNRITWRAIVNPRKARWSTGCKWRRSWEEWDQWVPENCWCPRLRRGIRCLMGLCQTLLWVQEMCESWFFSFFVILYFFLAALSLRWCTRAFSSCSEQGLLSSCSTWTLGRMGSIAADHWLSCPEACGIFSNQEWNLYVLHWQADS